MKILIILQKWEGGVGAVVKEISGELKSLGHKVDFISREEDLQKYNIRNSLRLIRKKVRNLVKNEQYDIIYTQDWGSALPLLFPYPLFWEKHYCCFHGIQPSKTRYIQKVVGEIMGRKLNVVGNQLKELFPKSNLIFNGVDTKKFKPIKQIKRIADSVGFSNWKESTYNYPWIKKGVENAGKKFVVAEGIPYEKMPEFYNKIETFISLPPSYTGFNLCWLEAMACGVPKIIGSNYGIGGKLPIDKIENFRSIEEAILKAKEKDYRKLVNKQFTWDKHVKKLIELWSGHGKYKN